MNAYTTTHCLSSHKLRVNGAMAILFLLLGSVSAGAQTLRFQQNFDGPTTSGVPVLGYSGSILLTRGVNVTHNGSPDNGKYYSEATGPTATVAWSLENTGTGTTAQTLLFNNFRFAAGSTNNRIEFLLTALTNNPQNGIGKADKVQVNISTNQGLSFYPVAVVTGNDVPKDNGTTGFKNGLVWGYMGNALAPGSLTASAAFNGLAPPASPAIFTPALAQSINSNNRAVDGTGGYGRVSIAITNATNVRVQVVMTNSLNQQIWGFDEFKVFSSDPIALPVELTQFGVTARPEGVNLSWTTATELNNDFFEVQRSATGTNFQAIGMVTSQGNSATTRTYALLDRTPLPGLAYYRLRQVDRDGTATFSQVATVRWAGEATALLAYPNPCAGLLQVLGTDGQTGRYRVLDSQGQTLLTGELSQTVPMHSLPSGMYVLETTTAAGRRFQRISRE